MKWMKAFISPVSFCIVFVSGLFVMFAGLALKTPAVKASSPQVTVFSNPASINPADRPSNNAGTNPGIPPSNYPSPIVVAGLTGVVSKVTVTFAITSTFPDDFDILLVGPTGVRSLVMSDAEGSGDHTNISYTFDQTAAATLPNDPTTVTPSGTFKPSNFLGFATPEPGGQDNFPMVSGLTSYPTDFTIFNGTNPNGTWNLYVVDDQVIDICSLPSGWSIDITTTTTAPADAPIDFNADGRSDYVVVRNVGGGQSGQLRWFFNHSSGGPTVAWDWGLFNDLFVIEDFDGDDKDDIAVFRPSVSPGQSRFYILNSATLTARVENFGEVGDDPHIVDDYDGDGKADLAVYRSGVNPGDQSIWFYRGSLNNPGGNTTYVPWGQNGDATMPGDVDGNGSADFTVRRPTGNQGAFWTRLSTGVVNPVTVFGFSSDIIVPGDYDGDGKCDIATVRSVSGMIQWNVRSSLNGSISYYTFGLSASDFVVQGDYDGDGKVEPAVWRPSIDDTMCFFYSLNSTNGAVTWHELGQNGDYPPGNYNTHF